MADALTPMMQQYQSLRRSLPPDTLLLFRLGDFYEMFFEDAKEAASILNVALTKRNHVPMCGVPFHAADTYLRRLIKAGRRVAICDQISEPKKGQIVQREITHIVSPGTISDLQMLDAKRNNFLAALYAAPGTRGAGSKTVAFGFAFVDLTTGDFRLTELDDGQALADELARVQPTEILVSEEQAAQFKDLRGVVLRDGYSFLFEQACYTVREHFKVQSLDGFGASSLPAAVSAAGAIFHYLKSELRRSLTHITRLTVYRTSQFMVIDAATQANLELVQSRGSWNAPGGGRDTSLLGALDRTVTPMGARRLRDWILHPLCDLNALGARQNMIGELLREPFLLGSLRETLKSIRDMERTVGRLTQTGGNARDLIVLRTSLEQIPPLKADLDALSRGAGFPAGDSPGPPGGNLCRVLLTELHELPHVVDLLAKAIVDEPPALTREGGLFRDGYYAPLDEIRAASREGKDWVAQLQQRAIEETGIKSLKVRYTSVFGYFIEVTKSNLHLVPSHWHRKQTVAGGERFITPDLKEAEGKILGADERAKALEYELFVQLRDETLRELPALQQTAGAIATVDALCALAETARLFGYCRPVLSDDLGITITDGRHP
nr:DNA mismatch repair protein MutS [Verrucomicrobiota bacterium]